jgi:hypothetical protein
MCMIILCLSIVMIHPKVKQFYYEWNNISVIGGFLVLKIRHLKKIVWPSYCWLNIQYFQTILRIILLLFYFTQFFALFTHYCITCTHIIIENTHLKKTNLHNIHKKKNMQLLWNIFIQCQKNKNKNIHNNNENVPHLTP